VGYGVGARWRSPVGPINVDVAYGKAVKEVRLHFSLGFTF
jgi:translocation and assembly module TamA